ncbi:MAG: autotransporter domain-containing protein [Endomicrobia bacterium]|nr:autotransporter domain-containing protein [Endomicrobiia bacterium]
MKKIVMLVFIFCIAFTVKASAQEIYVSSFSYFQTLYQSAGAKTIVLTNDITFTDDLGNMGGNLYIYGNGTYLGTNSGTRYEGFNLSAGQTLTLDNVSEIRGVNCAIYASSANVSILNGISFNGNEANSGGAVYNVYSTMTFTNGDVIFDGNNAVDLYARGGAIYNGGGLINFEMLQENTIIFSSNTAYVAGAMYNSDSSTITFINGNIIFSENGAFDAGAILNTNSLISFEMSSGDTIIFSSNNAYGAGAIANRNNALITFRNGDILFIGNIVGSGGGGAIHNLNSRINFEMSSGDIIIFSSNTAGSGGAIYNQSAVTTFTNADVIFSGNSATYGGGGAINNSYNAIYFTSSTVSFINNSASGYGGAIYSNYYTGTYFEMSSENEVIFKGNTAEMGGAIYAGYVNFSGGRVIFEGNTASDKGGALYITGNVVGWPVTFNTDGGEVLFRGNTANGKPNDVYMDIDAKLNITGSNTIRFEGGILSDSSGTGIEINKSGSGAMYLGGANEIYGDFNITGGDIILLPDAAYKGRALALGSTSALDMHNGTINTVNVASNFESKNNLKMDVFLDGNDKITAFRADIGGSLDIFAGVGTYYNKEFELIEATGKTTLDGEFASTSINDRGLKYEIKYENGIVKIIVNGMCVTRFEELSGLSYNQKETAKAFGKISESPGNWIQILSQMRDKQNAGTETDIAEVKDFLSQTSGYFLSNVIRNLAADSPNNEVYDKIRNHTEENETNNGLWVQIKGGAESFKEDDNSLGDYRDVSMGVMFGFDRFIKDKDVMWGAYARINKDNIEQGKHKADGNKNGLGVYGGYIKDDRELKTMLLLSYDKFNTERIVMGETAKADISAVTVNADIEAALKIELTEDIKLKPYAGIEIENAIYGGFKESGAGLYNLDADGGNYFRSAARAGAAIDYEKDIWILYANAEGKYIMSGTQPEIVSKFENTGVSFNSRGSEEGKISLGIGMGAEAEIALNWKIFVNGKYYTGERYENLYGNAGIRYLFGNKSRVFDKNKDAEKKFSAAKKLYNKGQYLRTTDMLSEIMVSYPDFIPPARLHAKIQSDMDKMSESREESDFSKLTYAKGYCAYYRAEYNIALAEWKKYIQFAGRNDEINEYIDKINSVLKLKELIEREAEFAARAEEMLNAGIEKYNASKWVLCIKDMEALQKFVTTNKFSQTEEYYNKAKEYIDLSVKELTKAVNTGKKEKPKEPEPEVEKKPEIDEAEADKKYNEGLVLYAQGKYLEAERMWEYTLRLNPNHQKAKIALSKLRSSGQLEE